MSLRPVVHSSSGRGHRRPLWGLWAAMVIAVALVVSLTSFALAAPGFPDVPTTDPYYLAIDELASEGIIGGYADGNFGPSDPVTRQQFAKMIVLTGGYPVSESDVCPFTDVARSDATTFYPDNYVAVCAANGITMGKTLTTFDPYANITRYQVVSMVVRTADNLRPGLLTAPPSGWAGNATWANDVTHGANAARAEYNSLLLGLNLDALNPTENMTRGEVAQVLHNLLGKLTYWSNAHRGVYYYGLNVDQPPLDNVKVRQALALAIDRQAIVDSLGRVGVLPATGFVPPGIPGFDVINQQFLKATAQVDQAKALLAAAGYENGVGLPEIKLYVNSGFGHEAIADAVTDQWQAIGVTATVVPMSFQDFWSLLPTGGDFMVYRSGWIADYNDAYELLNVFRGGDHDNFTNWTDAAYDQALADALLKSSDAERWAAYGALEKTLTVDEMPIIPIYWYE